MIKIRCNKILFSLIKFYQVYVKSFYDTNNDGIGDINGIYTKLDYLKNVTNWGTIILSSIMKSDEIDDGYAVTDYMQVDPIFGINDDLKRMIEKAHATGLKVILDFVPNHTSDQHEWFKKSVRKETGFEDFYVWHDGIPTINLGRPLPPNNWVRLKHLKFNQLI